MLEPQTKLELDVTLCTYVRSQNLTEIAVAVHCRCGSGGRQLGIAEIPVRSAIDRSVGDVDRLRPQLQLKPLSEVEALEDRHVQRAGGWAGVALQAQVTACVHAGGRILISHLEGAGVEPKPIGSGTSTARRGSVGILTSDQIGQALAPLALKAVPLIVKG